MSDRRTITLAAPRDVSGYRALLRSVAALASSAGLIVRSPKVQLSARADSLLAALTPFLLATEDVDRWPGTQLIGDRKSRRFLYRLAPESIALLVSAATGIFDWVNPELPEDLHLLRADGTVVLGTVAQEEDAWLELTAAELGSLLAESPAEVRELLQNDP